MTIDEALGQIAVLREALKERLDGHRCCPEGSCGPCRALADTNRAAAEFVERVRAEERARVEKYSALNQAVREAVEPLRARVAQLEEVLREALEVAHAEDGNLPRGWQTTLDRGAAALAGSDSKWLAEHDARVRAECCGCNCHVTDSGVERHSDCKTCREALAEEQDGYITKLIEHARAAALEEAAKHVGDIRFDERADPREQAARFIRALARETPR